MTDDDREAALREIRAQQPKGETERNIDFLLRRLDEARRPPTLAEIRERHWLAVDEAVDAGYVRYSEDI